MIDPHGGSLTPRQVDAAKTDALKQQYGQAPQAEADPTTVADLELLAVGALAPLTGFLGEDDYRGVVDNMRLANDLVWTIPVTLPVDEQTAKAAVEAGALWLTHEGNKLALVHAQDSYKIDINHEAQNVFRTTDQAHPGVERLHNLPQWRVGGSVDVLTLPEQPFPDYRLTPEQTRKAFADRGWKTVVAFQTRNPIHRAHEYLTKVALEGVDGLLLHPLVGATKAGDIPADIRMQCYETMMAKYYNPERVMLSVFPAAMRYAGPREAIFHALLRKNYGCTHFIVGRDHAGVGDYYGTYDAQDLFDKFTPDEIGITPLKFEHAFYCTVTKQMATAKTTNSKPEERIFLSGTKVREMLSRGELPPEEFTRPEVAELLVKAMSQQ